MNRTMKYDTSLFGADPVFCHPTGGGWWFWNETWAYATGPYYSEWEAEKMLSLYCFITLDGAELLCLNPWKAYLAAGVKTQDRHLKPPPLDRDYNAPMTDINFDAFSDVAELTDEDMARYEPATESLACHGCKWRSECKYVDDAFNMDGDCLAMK